jgi:hypothetical protein
MRYQRAIPDWKSIADVVEANEPGTLVSKGPRRVRKPSCHGSALYSPHRQRGHERDRNLKSAGSFVSAEVFPLAKTGGILVRKQFAFTLTGLPSRRPRAR